MTNERGGRKDDEGKLDWSLLPFNEVEEIIKVLMVGAKKYGAGNWMEVPNGKRRFKNALQRHVAEYFKGAVKDKDDGYPALAHVACNCLFLMYLDHKK